MKVRTIAALVMALLFSVGSASASSIGVYFAADGSDCDATVAAFSQLNWYVLAHLYGDAGTAGLTGTEFRVANVPGAWFHTITASPAANTVLGNLFTGTNVAFAGCQPGPWVLLYSVSTFAVSALPAMDWQVLAHSTPSNPDFNCPLIVLCDAPVYTKICVPGGEAFVNGGTCNIGVAPATWSQVKQMFN
jgi:hypothetical protein